MTTEEIEAQKVKDAETKASHEAALNKARQDEKDKQFAKIQELQTKLDAATAETTTLKDSVTKLTNDLATLKASMKTDGNVNVEKLMEEVIAKTRTTVEGETAAKMAEMQKQLDELSTENTSVKVEKLRSRLIAEAGGENALIVELVSGNNEESIKTSIAAAKAAFDRIKGKIQANGDRTTVPPAVNTPGAGGGNGTVDTAVGADAMKALGDVRKMSPKEYAANREKIMQQTRGVLLQGANPMTRR